MNKQAGSLMAVRYGILLACLFLWSCEGSFGPTPGTSSQEPSAVHSTKGWYHHRDNLDLFGVIQPAPSGPFDTLPAGARICIGWESGTPSSPTFLFSTFSAPLWLFDSTALVQFYAFDIHLADSIPLEAIKIDSVTGGKLAVGHVFLVTDSRIRDQILIPYDSIDSYGILGSMEQTILLFRESTPILRKLVLDNSVSQEGYNIFQSFSYNLADPYFFDGFTILSRSTILYMDIKMPAGLIKWRNRLWVQ